MKSRRRGEMPTLEALEGKRLLSTAATAPTGGAAIVEVARLGPRIQPRGSFHGIYGTLPTLPDLPTTYAFSGSGKLGHLRSAGIGGSLRSIGLIPNSQAGGTLTLAFPRGSLTLRLTGPVQNGPSPLPTSFHVQVVGGTGRLAHAHGAGTAQLVLFAADMPTPTNRGHGTFTLTLTP
jgi:hypothetical protein